ncbi:CRISPR-associated endonuclease Cas2 [Desulfovibrio cuneatus]|uniref:CRISPR-associated endonuclease Cas2 n=1 Tax=Desulfovibrio cuneatus TaxID=159728 RepID=UPI0004107405|nr:CRISPR-associated endonuclease Cas2 [Desulfovibrio cuneatus]
MWVVVMFDLPVSTKMEMRRATLFRNSLLELGFSRKQFSVYMRHAANLENAKQLAQKVKKCLVPNGYVSVLYITDRQYGMTENFFGPAKAKNEGAELATHQQLMLF